MTTLLFLSTDHSARSQMAEAFARARAPADTVVLSAGTRPAGRVHPVAVEVMADVGIDISAQRPRPFSSLAVHSIDVVIALCSDAAAECALLLPGLPPHVSWNLPDPASAQGDAEQVREAFRRARDEVHRLVNDLFDRGYLVALAKANAKARLVLENLSEGIIAHDLSRRIFQFNKAAEEITGYDRTEVLGRDCHDIFPDGFCGQQCSFRDSKVPSFERLTYPVAFADKGGERRELEMSVRSIVDDARRPVGVLASFRDLTRENTLAKRLGEVQRFSGIIGRDKKMLEVFDLIRSVTDLNVPVLIQGDSGTGKELVAAAVHNEGARAKRNFVPVNCAALPEGLLESELFGHVRGAFTGAIRDKKGRFELADGGTIFLDEIGDISPAMQVKLLRVVQEGRFERVGGTQTIRVDVRIVSATNKDLKAEVAAGRFRDDLYYRLCVVPIWLPPLRERCGDISLLVEHFTRRLSEETGRTNPTVSPTALNALLSYDWPGNVRELQNALQFAAVKSGGERIEVKDLPPHIVGHPRRPSPFVSESPAHRPPGRRKKLDAAAVRDALHQAGGNKAAAARLLGVGRATLYRFLDREADAEQDARQDR